MKGLLQTTAECASRYLKQLDDRPVAPRCEAVARLAKFDEPLLDEPSSPESVLTLLDEVGSPATMATAGRRYFGFVIGGVLPVTLAANWMAGTWDQNAALITASPVAAEIEKVASKWLLEVLGLPPESGCSFVTGATMANFTGLAAARHHVLEKLGWDVETQGLFGAPPITVIIGGEAHASLLKALGLLGFGRERVVVAPVDGQGRMRANALPTFSGPTIVCIQAGNVNTGAFDPAGDIIRAAHAADAWVHVDGAFGLWAAAAPHRAYLVAGYGEADSWATDAHKWLNVPYDCGLAFIRDDKSLRASMGVSAAYLLETEKREPSQYTPEMSRRARGIEVWAALRCLGRSGLADLIERNCCYATRFAEGLAVAGYQVLNEVALNQVLVSFGDAETTRRVIAGIQSDGTCWCGGTVWHGYTAMRISVSSWATTEQDVEASLAAILRVASTVKQEI
jgi:glutamate/tyrosine decarboxylase-like PLP-dependent enzyme